MADAAPPATAALPALRQALERISPLSTPAWAGIAAVASQRQVAMGDLLLRTGQPAQHILYVHQGLLREYYLGADGAESTRRFCSAGEFSGSLADLLARGPAAVNIEALATAQLVCVPWAAVDALAEDHPSLMKLLRRFAELLYVRKMRREFEMLTLPAAQRLRNFALEHPGLHAQLPRHLVASYLGITPVHLSRLAGARKRPPAPAAPAQKT
jgi:CRP-like cAMP-binding protein